MTHLTFSSSQGGRNLPRSLLGSTAGSEAESGVFAVPTTLPPNSSRHNRMFSPNKEAELALKQQLDSISVRRKSALKDYIVHVSCTDVKILRVFVTDAVRYFPFKTKKTSKQATSETTCSSGKRETGEFITFKKNNETGSTRFLSQWL